MATSKVKVGLIGAGAFSDFCLKGYQHIKNIELTSIYDPNSGNADNIAKKYKIKNIASSAQEIIEDKDIKIVVVLTPPRTHFEYAFEAVKNGKNVLVEKPIAFNIKDAEKLINLAIKNKVFITTNLVLRYHLMHQKIKSIVESGKYGSLRQIITSALLAKYPDGHWYWDPKISGGFFLNTYTHFIDLYNYILGENPSDLKSYGSVEKGHTIICDYADKARATLSVNLKVSNSQEAIHTNYIFDKAVIRTSDWFPSTMTTILDSGRVIKTAAPEKLSYYQEVLSNILSDLVKKINNPEYVSIIDYNVLLSSVVNPTKAEENREV